MTTKSAPPAPRARIDLDSLAANARLARRLAGEAKVMAVVKADAYGHGALPVSEVLAAHVDALAVARVSEGVTLRDGGIEAPIVVLQGCLASGELDEARRQRLEIVVHRTDQLDEALVAFASPGEAQARIWVQHDSGMHRLGLDRGQVARAVEALRATPGVREVVVISHLACADEEDDDFTTHQLEAFELATEDLETARSLANSAALLSRPETHFEWVRAGILLYGASPFGPRQGVAAELRPVMRLESDVIALRRIGAGEGVGYGRRYVSSERRVIGTVGIGYGDGYPRAAPDGTPVAVAGRRVPLVGRVSMDSLTVDLTEIEGVEIGAPVELWGEHVRVEEVAAACRTISYELLSRVGPRVPRIYEGNDENG